MTNPMPSLTESINAAKNPAKQLRLTYAALHEAAHCVIACDEGEHVTQVKLCRRTETGWMRDTSSGFSPDKEVRILLAGVAFEFFVWQDYTDAFAAYRNDFKAAFDTLKTDHSLDDIHPRIRTEAEIVSIYNRELKGVGFRLIALWAVVEYVAALILKNHLAIFPRNCVRWSDKIRRCIRDQKYLREQAPWASQISERHLDWLSTMRGSCWPASDILQFGRDFGVPVRIAIDAGSSK